MLGRNVGLGSAVTATPTPVASPGSRADRAPGPLTDVHSWDRGHGELQRHTHPWLEEPRRP